MNKLFILIINLINFVRAVYFLIYSLLLKTPSKNRKIAVYDAFGKNITSSCFFFLEKVDYDLIWLERWIFCYYAQYATKKREIYFNNNKYFTCLLNNEKILFNNLVIALGLEQ